MGDRISIQFKNGEEKSPILFSHWDGIDLKNMVDEYYHELKLNMQDHGDAYPLSRFEPGTVMVDFIRFMTSKIGRIMSNYYIACDINDGDNSDNGHYILNLKNGKWKHIKSEW